MEELVVKFFYNLETEKKKMKTQFNVHSSDKTYFF